MKNSMLLVLIIALNASLFSQGLLSNYNHSISRTSLGTYESYYLYKNNTLIRELTISNASGWNRKPEYLFSNGNLLLIKDNELSNSNELYFNALHMDWIQIHYFGIMRNGNNQVIKYTEYTGADADAQWEIIYGLKGNPLFMVYYYDGESYKYEVKQDRNRIIVDNIIFSNVSEKELQDKLTTGLINNYYYIIHNEDYYKEGFLNGRYKLDRILNSLTKDELSLFRNTIFAYYGYIFKTQSLKTIFANFSWYSPDYNNSSCFENMSDYNKSILEKIQIYEGK
jgi:hypothetical protein